MPNRKEIKVIEEAFDVKEDVFIDMREIAAEIPVEERLEKFLNWYQHE